MKTHLIHKNIFSRVEIKYLLTLSQRDELLELMKDRMVKDPHGRSTSGIVKDDKRTVPVSSP